MWDSTEKSSSNELQRYIEKLENENKELQKYKTLFKEAEYLSSVDSWEWDIENTKIIVSNERRKIHGHNSKVLTYNKLLQLVHPEDIPYMDNKLQDCLNNSAL